MTKSCDLTGKTVQTGNNVSHSHRKTRRRYLPNLHAVSLQSDALKQTVKLRIAIHTLRSIDKNGGLDSFLLKTSNIKLTDTAVKLKKRIKKALEKTASAA